MTQIQSKATTLSKFERLKIANQFHILAKLSDGYEAEDYAAKAAVFERGYPSLYSEALDGYSEELDGSVSEDVENILEMHSALLFSVQDMPESERGDLLDRVKFEGFDGNNESSHLSFATFLHDRLGKYKELMIFNSHCPTLDRYRAQLKKWDELKQSYRMGKTEIEALLASKRYWE